MQFRNYMNEKKGYDLNYKEFVKAIDKATENKKALKKIYKNLDASFLKGDEKEALKSQVYRLIQGL